MSASSLKVTATSCDFRRPHVLNVVGPDDIMLLRSVSGFSHFDNTGSMVGSNGKSEIRKLNKFSRLNPEVKVSRDKKGYIVENPWGDSSIKLVIEEKDALVDLINNIRLPPRFSALWHKETGDLEFIAMPIPDDYELWEVLFDFHYQGEKYKCGYDEASKELHAIVKSSKTAEPFPKAGYRNLTTIKEITDQTGNVFSLASFWIRNISLNEEKLESLARHINFYIRYYKKDTPIIAIHEDEKGLDEVPKLEEKGIPKKINAREIDTYLLGLWENASSVEEPFRRYLYHYQILEYAAFYYVKEEVAQSVERVISAPELLSDLKSATRSIIDAVVDDRLKGANRMYAVVKRYTRPEEIWRQIETRKEFFSGSTAFEGGYKVSPLVNEDWGISTFKTSWHPKLPKKLRDLRNALVHARELRGSGAVLPTAYNRHLLQPWADLISKVAKEVMIHGNV